MLEPPSFLAADEPILRHEVVLEDELGAVDPLVAELLELAAHREAFPLLREEEAHPPVARRRVRIGLHQEGKALAMDPVRDPGLGTVDDVTRPVAARDGPDRGLEIRAPVRLGQREAAADLATRELRKPLAFLRRRAVAHQGRRHDEVGVVDTGDRHPHPGHPLHDAGVGGRPEAEAAILLGNDRAEQAELLHPLHDVLGPDVVLLEVMRVGRDLLLQELLDRVEDDVLFLGPFRGRPVGNLRCHLPASLSCRRCPFVSRLSSRDPGDGQPAIESIPGCRITLRQSDLPVGCPSFLATLSSPAIRRSPRPALSRRARARAGGCRRSGRGRGPPAGSRSPSPRPP